MAGAPTGELSGEQAFIYVHIFLIRKSGSGNQEDQVRQNFLQN